ncbi:hypothetical protein VTO73DRAFT_10618 [Trametes versicolor]
MKEWWRQVATRRGGIVVSRAATSVILWKATPQSTTDRLQSRSKGATYAWRGMTLRLVFQVFHAYCGICVAD